MKKDKLLNFIGMYWLIGIIYALIDLKFFIQNGIYPSEMFLFKKFILTSILYPFMLLLELWFNVTLSIFVWQKIIVWSIIIIGGWFVLHKFVFGKIRPEIKHTIFIIIAIIFWIGYFAVNTHYDEEFILKNQNYRTIMIDYDTRYNDNLDYYEGFEMKNGLRVFFVDDDNFKRQGYVSENTGLPYMGVYAPNQQAIYVNAQRIRERARMESEYYPKLENTLLHEITHYLDDTRLIRNFDKVYKLEYDKDISPHPYYGATINRQTQDYYVKLYLDADDVPFNIKESVNFRQVFYRSMYKPSAYDSEIIARINALCFVLDEDANKNKVRKADYKICEEFEFPDYYYYNYDAFLKDFVVSYVETFQMKTQTPIKISKVN